jgi:hypothetical protein
MQRPAISLAALAALIMVGLALTLVGLVRAPGLARAQAIVAPDPSANVPLGPLPASCAKAPVGPACEEAAVASLDSARRRLGLGPYNLPPNFTGLAPGQQLLVLSNLDRLAYGLAPVAGLNEELDESALAGVEQLSDPLPPIELLPGTAVWGFTSNWAGNFPNAPAAYYEWMYDDGYGSANAACTSPGADGCWGHRQDVLWAFPEGWLAMGAATGTDVYGTPGFAMVIAYTHGWQSPAYYYTWDQTATVASASKRPSIPCAPRRWQRTVRAAQARGAKTRRGSQAHRAKTAFEPRAHGTRAVSAPRPGACSGAPASG